MSGCGSMLVFLPIHVMCLSLIQNDQSKEAKSISSENLIYLDSNIRELVIYIFETYSYTALLYFTNFLFFSRTYICSMGT